MLVACYIFNIYLAGLCFKHKVGKLNIAPSLLPSHDPVSSTQLSSSSCVLPPSGQAVSPVQKGSGHHGPSDVLIDHGSPDVLIDHVSPDVLIDHGSPDVLIYDESQTNALINHETSADALLVHESPVDALVYPESPADCLKMDASYSIAFGTEPYLASPGYNGLSALSQKLTGDLSPKVKNSVTPLKASPIRPFKATSTITPIKSSDVDLTKQVLRKRPTNSDPDRDR